MVTASVVYHKHSLELQHVPRKRGAAATSPYRAAKQTDIVLIKTSANSWSFLHHTRHDNSNHELRIISKNEIRFHKNLKDNHLKVHLTLCYIIIQLIHCGHTECSKVLHRLRVFWSRHSQSFFLFLHLFGF